MLRFSKERGALMKYAAYALASVFCLTACNKGPEVNLKNASANQVSEAVKKSGVMSSDSMVEPGLWESKVTVQEMNIPGMPPQFADKMKQSMAEQRNHASRHCIKPEDVKKPKEDFFGADKSCKYDHFTMGGGKIDVAMVCHEEDTTQNMNMTGTGGQEQGMSMKMHVDSNRVGECTGKDD